jgi:hypothetical protein
MCDYSLQYVARRERRVTLRSWFSVGDDHLPVDVELQVPAEIGDPFRQLRRSRAVRQSPRNGRVSAIVAPRRTKIQPLTGVTDRNGQPRLAGAWRANDEVC